MQPVIRTATVEDADGIAHVHVVSWQAAYRGLLPDRLLDGLSVERRAEGWRRLVADRSDGSVFVAELDGEVVAVAAGGGSRDEGMGDDVGELFLIYLLPAVWGSGLAAVLLAKIEETLRRDGYRSATLWVLETNTRARRFYERAGWSIDGARKTEERDDFDLVEVRYRKALRAG